MLEPTYKAVIELCSLLQKHNVHSLEDSVRLLRAARRLKNEADGETEELLMYIAESLGNLDKAVRAMVYENLLREVMGNKPEGFVTLFLPAAKPKSSESNKEDMEELDISDVYDDPLPLAGEEDTAEAKAEK